MEKVLHLKRFYFKEEFTSINIVDLSESDYLIKKLVIFLSKYFNARTSKSIVGWWRILFLSLLYHLSSCILLQAYSLHLIIFLNYVNLLLRYAILRECSLQGSPLGLGTVIRTLNRRYSAALVPRVFRIILTIGHQTEYSPVGDLTIPGPWRGKEGNSSDPV
jgi:hypothetical protein